LTLLSHFNRKNPFENINWGEVMARVSIEDCLDFIENRFALVSVAAHRTRQLMDGAQPFVKSKNKEAVTALREIAEGYVVADAENVAGVDMSDEQ
jgi:DNA-directed RNA polymerase subunit omega